MGSKNHEIVPTPLITQLSALRGGSGVHKCISTLAKANLIARMKNAKCKFLEHLVDRSSPLTVFAPDDGYRLTYGGLDYLALHTHLKRQVLYSSGNCIGVGKESDIYVVASSTGAQYILKIHRLGRISFRSIKNNRDYLQHRSSASWMHMSRLSALKEFTFMKVLRENGFRVPEPVAHSRHTVVMELIDAFPLRQIQEVPNPAGLYAELIDIVLRLASFGLIHGDFNEFNVLIREDESPAVDTSSDTKNGIPDSKPAVILVPVIIDFPQMVSVDHTNAEMYFNRDINCIKRFFERRFNFLSDEAGPLFADAKKLAGGPKSKRLDVEVEASGFSRKMAKELEKYMQEVGVDGDAGHEAFGGTGEGDFDAPGTSSGEEGSSHDLSQDSRGDLGSDGLVKPSGEIEPGGFHRHSFTSATSIARLSLEGNS